MDLAGRRKLLHDEVYPNSYQDYVPLVQPWASAGIASAGAKTDLLLTGLCDSQPVQQLACTNLAVEGGDFACAKSRHPGGVNASFGDGSVRFVKNTISPLTWVQIHSMAGGEVLSSDSY